jgi:steroid 5-alpha reductase family enzyme
VSFSLSIGHGLAGRRVLVLVLVLVAVWAVGFGFETVGDWQLRRWRAVPAHAGQVLDRGLLRYTRHPNYFGDAVAWFGLWLLACSVGSLVSAPRPATSTRRWLLRGAGEQTGAAAEITTRHRARPA